MTILRADPELSAQARELAAALRDAWRQGLLAGFNGNASLLPAGRPHELLITAAGAPKGRSPLSSLTLARLSDGSPLPGQARPSSEIWLHLAIYGASPARAILHSHPPALLALELAGQGQDLRDLLARLPLFEAGSWSASLGMAPRLEPGSPDLAQACGAAAASLLAAQPSLAGGAVWMSGHGLCAFGPDPAWALALTEQLEHLARVALLAKTEFLS